MQVLLEKNSNLTSRHNPSENINITRGSPGYSCKLSDQASFENFEKKTLFTHIPLVYVECTKTMTFQFNLFPASEKKIFFSKEHSSKAPIRVTVRLYTNL
jgi:hypothetical protein